MPMLRSAITLEGINAMVYITLHVVPSCGEVFDSPSISKSHPGACPRQQNENSVQYVLYPLFLRIQTKFGIEIFKIDMLMIFDLLTSPQGHQFGPRIKMLLAFDLVVISVDLIMPHDHV